MKWHSDYADAREAGLLDPVWVEVNYQTTAGNPATWRAWTADTDDLRQANEAASRHVGGFKRCLKVNGGSAGYACLS